MEEAAELIQALSKLLIHGDVAEGPDGIKYDNIGDVIMEYEQLRGYMISILDDRGMSYGMMMDKLGAKRNDDTKTPR